MTYPLAHKIDTSRPYTNAANTDIRATFERARNALQQKGKQNNTADQLPEMARLRVPAA